jgi:hypothetical protein
MKRVLLLTAVVATLMIGSAAPSHADVYWSDGAWASGSTRCTNQGSLSNKIAYSIMVSHPTNYRIWMYQYSTGQWRAGAWQTISVGQGLVTGEISGSNYRGWFRTVIQFGRYFPGQGYVNRYDWPGASDCYL